MFSQLNKNIYLLKIFKFATIIHILCLMISLIINHYISATNPIHTVIDYILFICVMCISLIVSIKIIHFFTQRHKYFIQNHEFLGLIIESCIAAIITGLLYFNQEITEIFVLFIAKLSKQAHNNNILILVILVLLFLCLELYHAYEIDKESITTNSIKKIVRNNGITLMIKIFIMIGSAIGLIHPIINFLKLEKLNQFDNIIFHFTTTEFFVYIHTIIMILLGLWITIGFYYVYKFYKKGK